MSTTPKGEGAPSEATKERIKQSLGLFNQTRYRIARWRMIDQARGAGLTWNEIGDALGVKPTAAARIYSADERLVPDQD